MHNSERSEVSTAGTHVASLIFEKVAFEYRISTAFLSRSTHFFVAFLPFGKQTSLR